MSSSSQRLFGIIGFCIKRFWFQIGLRRMLWKVKLGLPKFFIKLAVLMIVV